MIQSGEFLGWLLSKIAGLLMKLAVPISKNILALLGITAAASAIDAGIQKKKKNDSGITTLIIANEEMNDRMKIVHAPEDSNIFLKRFPKAIEDETKEQKGGLLGM